MTKKLWRLFLRLDRSPWFHRFWVITSIVALVISTTQGSKAGIIVWSAFLLLDIINLTKSQLRKQG